MKLRISPSGEIVEAKLRKAPASLTRAYGIEKLAYWTANNGMRQEVPVIKVDGKWVEYFGYTEIKKAEGK